MKKLTRKQIKSRAKEEYQKGNIRTARDYHTCALCGEQIRRSFGVARDCVYVGNYRVCLNCARVSEKEVGLYS